MVGRDESVVAAVLVVGEGAAVAAAEQQAQLGKPLAGHAERLTVPPLPGVVALGDLDVTSLCSPSHAAALLDFALA